MDRLRLGPLVHAVERGTVARREQLRDGLVRADHELLDERVGVRLALPLRVGDAAAAVELEHDLGRLDAQRAAREAGAPQLARALVEAAQRLHVLELLLAGEDLLRLSVRQPRIAADHGAVEASARSRRAGARR